MAAGVVVGSILPAADQLLGVEELTVGAGADLVDDGRLEVDEDGARDVLSATGLSEEGAEGVIGHLVGHAAVGLDAVLKAVELPAGVS